MMNQTKIAVMCNNTLAIPAIQSLIGMRKLSFLVIPETNIEIVEMFASFTLQTGLPVLIVNKQNWQMQLDKMLQELKTDYIFMMTFPWIVKEDILKRYPNKFYNFHYGLLPEMRGSNPVFESIAQQKTETGITVHLVEKGLDTGPVVLKKKIPLNENATYGSLCSDLAKLGAAILPEVLLALQVTPTPQDEAKAVYYKKPGNARVCIKWETQDANAIRSLLQACNPWNKGAYAGWKGKAIRLIQASVAFNEQQEVPGTILSINESEGLVIQCINNTKLIVEIIYSDEGFFSKQYFQLFNFQKRQKLTSLY